MSVLRHPAAAPPPSADLTPAPSASEAASSPDHFNAFYEAHFSFVWRMLRRLGVADSDVSDATQDVFVVASRRLPDLRGPELARSFAYGIVVRVAHQYRRASSRSRSAETGIEQLYDEEAPTAHDSAERAQGVALLDRVLAALDLEKREIFVLVELEQLSVPEVATLTGVNKNTIYTRLRAARQAFDSELARYRKHNRRFW
ncbi:MAG: sigma-70 family RNA polymerase sigma factor [Pseudomonadota bacterium]